MNTHLSVLEYLKRQMAGNLPTGATCGMAYPTAISRLLGFRLCEIDQGYACLELNTDTTVHGNQQGTVHGGLLAELADAAMGTAHSTHIEEGESFTSIDLRISFYRPVWQSKLRACARNIQRGKTIAHYQCEIIRDDGKPVALASSTIMTLRGVAAQGR